MTAAARLHDPGTEIPSAQPCLGVVHVWLVVGYKLYTFAEAGTRLVEMVRLVRCEPLLGEGRKQALPRSIAEGDDAKWM